MTAPTGKPRGRPRKSESIVREDGYANAFLSIGTKQDRSAYTQHVFGRELSYGELESLYISDGFARKIIDVPSDEMLRCGFGIEGLTDDDKLESKLEEIKAVHHISNALKWSDLYGGSLMVLIINDGGLLEEPLNEDGIKELEAIRVYDRHNVSRHQKYDDPADKRYGQTKIYMISPVNAAPYMVHESRCIVVDGVGVPERIRDRNDGWGVSRIQQCYDQLVKLGMSYHWANALMERAQQAIHGIPGLTDILRAPGGDNLIRRRIDLVDMARSVSNTVVIDSQESYDLKATSLSSVPEIMDRISLSLAAVSGIPESILYGRRQQGIGTTGNIELEQWYATVSRYQEVRLLPIIDKLVTIILKASGQYIDNYTIEFNPLWSMSDKEKAEISEKKAKTAEIYVSLGALDASEVRKYIADDYEIEEVELMSEAQDDIEE